MPFFLLVNNYQLIVPGHTPNVQSIPSDNDNDKNKYIP